jgi:hypothetical protein
VKLDAAAIGRALCDRMTESVITSEVDLARVVASGGAPRKLGTIALGADGVATLREASTRLGLALAQDEIEYLVARYRGCVAIPRMSADDVRAGEQRALPAQDHPSSDRWRALPPRCSS